MGWEDVTFPLYVLKGDAIQLGKKEYIFDRPACVMDQGAFTRLFSCE